ncbi:hypothetical protein D3C80_778820 [compost metagenome]
MHDGFVDDLAFAAGQERDVARCAAHIEGDEVLDAGHAADRLCGDDAGARAGEYGADRQIRCRIKPDDAAIRLGQLRGD